MAEPSTGALAVTGVLASVGLGAAFPQLDLAALVGAFGGAFFYVVFAKDISTWRRVGYLLAGWIGGYFGAAELMGRAWTQTAGFSGSSACEPGRRVEWLPLSRLRCVRSSS